ncbi:type IV secretory system conjugative DNA transfer family protein, partial [Xanthomonas cassavae CFBP 4642]|nr:type IV secretory system conjugative DNA transfer family protein [Xanthomonas cassavae CFBP 4642]
PAPGQQRYHQPRTLNPTATQDGGTSVIAQREEELYQLAPSIFRKPYLTSTIEDEWFRSYPKGPHKD